jgi:hypothetical protein
MQMTQSNDVPAIPPGGAETAIDLASERDRGLVRQAMKNWPKRWAGLDAVKKATFTKQLADAGDAAANLLQASDADLALKAAATVASIVRTAAMMEGQNQADEHVEDKNSRLDQGKVTERVEGVVFKVPGMKQEE